jgi:cell wall-associated NlpC family hydrolase
MRSRYPTGQRTRSLPVIRFVWAGALAIVATACASTGAVPKPFPMPSSPRPSVSDRSYPAVTVEASAVMDTALSLLGTRYRMGGVDRNGFDCSGFTQYVFAQHGLALPREVRDQFEFGDRVGSNDLAAGDLLFFSTVAPGASHVAISLGDGRFVHAPSSRGVVRVERLSSGYWRTRFIGARRVMHGFASLSQGGEI